MFLKTEIQCQLRSPLEARDLYWKSWALIMEWVMWTLGLVKREPSSLPCTPFNTFISTIEDSCSFFMAQLKSYLSELPDYTYKCLLFSCSLNTLKCSLLLTTGIIKYILCNYLHLFPPTGLYLFEGKKLSQYFVLTSS